MKKKKKIIITIIILALIALFAYTATRMDYARLFGEETMITERKGE